MAIPGRPLSEQDRQRIIRLREAGLSIRETAKAQMVSPVTVHKVLKSSQSGLAK